MFTEVHDAKLLTGGTYPKFIRLLDNYNPYTGTAEPPCSACVVEENDWLDAVIETSTMQVVWDFLKSKGLYIVIYIVPFVPGTLYIM